MFFLLRFLGFELVCLGFELSLVSSLSSPILGLSLRGYFVFRRLNLWLYNRRRCNSPKSFLITIQMNKKKSYLCVI